MKTFTEWVRKLHENRPKGSAEGGADPDPEKTAMNWLSNTPALKDVYAQKRGTPQTEHSDSINKEEIWKVVRAISDTAKNNQVQAAYMAKTQPPGAALPVYEEPLVPYILKIKKDELPDANKLDKTECSIFVPGPDLEPLFGFVPGKGCIIILVPPMTYKHQDLFGIWSGVLHETRHALDFAMGKLTAAGAPTTMDAYANMIFEARSHGDQIVQTLNEIIRKLHFSPQKAIDMCQYLFVDSPKGTFRMAQETMPVVKLYLEYMRKDPSLWMQEDVTTKKEAFNFTNPPAIVRHHVDSAVEHALAVCQKEFETIHSNLVQWLEVHQASHFVKVLEQRVKSPLP